MFKKPFSIGQSHKVSGADRKKLRRALEKDFGVSEEGLEALLPAKAGELECAKLASPSRVVLYLHDNQPILLDPNGKGDYMPTVFALWRLPTLLPQVYVKHPAVSRYIVGGADLMLPGVLLPPTGLPSFEKEQLVAVCSPGNAAPIAVGRATMATADASARIVGSGALGPKGKLVELIQHYGDYLWQDVGGRAVPNEGFLPDGVVPVAVPSVEATLARDGRDGDNWNGDEGVEEESAGTEGGGIAAGESAATAVKGLTLGSASTGDADPDANNSSNSNKSMTSAPPSSGGLGGGGGGGGEREEEVLDMDSLLETVLLQALHKSVKDSDLPLNSSVLWNQHMLPVRPAGSTLDVKKSKHKKMSKFLQSYGKQGLMTVKEDKHSGDVIVTSINRNSSLYKEHRPYKVSSTTAAEASSANAAAAAISGPTGPSAAAAAAAGSGTTAAAPSGRVGVVQGGSELVQVEEVYKPGRELRPIFEEMGMNPEALYTEPEAAEVLFGYVKLAGLEQGAPDNQVFVLNPTLCDALFKGLIKKGEKYPERLVRVELWEAFMRRMHMQCRITRGPQQVLRKRHPPAVQISTEKRQGNKRVTKVVGLEHFLVDVNQFATECQRKFACSTNVVELLSKDEHYEVVVQGSFLEPVADFLMQQYGIPRKYFLVKQ